MRGLRWGVLMLVLGLLAWQRLAAPGSPTGHAPAGDNAPIDARTNHAVPAVERPDPAVAGPSAAAVDLPPEAQATLRLIRAGGPFPYARDGVVFGNYERRLPDRPRGYYHEYTVPTPGVASRGARRLVAGGQPPDEFWYSDDHYESFHRLEPGP